MLLNALFKNTVSFNLVAVLGLLHELFLIITIIVSCFDVTWKWSELLKLFPFFFFFFHIKIAFHVVMPVSMQSLNLEQEVRAIWDWKTSRKMSPFAYMYVYGNRSSVLLHTTAEQFWKTVNSSMECPSGQWTAGTLASIVLLFCVWFSYLWFSFCLEFHSLILAICLHCNFECQCSVRKK